MAVAAWGWAEHRRPRTSMTVFLAPTVDASSQAILPIATSQNARQPKQSPQCWFVVARYTPMRNLVLASVVVASTVLPRPRCFVVCGSTSFAFAPHIFVNCGFTVWKRRKDSREEAFHNGNGRRSTGSRLNAIQWARLRCPKTNLEKFASFGNLTLKDCRSVFECRFSRSWLLAS